MDAIVVSVRIRKKSIGLGIIAACVFALLLQTLFAADLHRALDAAGIDAWYFVVRLALCGAVAVFIAIPSCWAETLQTSRALPAGENLRRRFDPLLGMRGMACACVLLGHWFIIVFPPSTMAWSWPEYGARALLSASPWCGVWIFFTLSGYLMGKGFVSGRYTLTSDGLVEFFRNRILRIFPVMVTATLLVSILFHREYLAPNAGILKFWINFLTLDTFNGPIGALWSVGTEMQFYLAVPVLFALMKRLGCRGLTYLVPMALIIVVMASIKYSALLHHPERWMANIYMPTLANLDTFLPGLLSAFLVRDLKQNLRWSKAAFYGGLTTLVLLYVVAALWSYSTMVAVSASTTSASFRGLFSFGPGVTALLTCLALVLFECAPRSLPRLPRLWKVQTWAGVMTYSVYVAHEPVMLWLRTFFPHDLRFGTVLCLLPIGFAAIIIAASILFWFVEKPFDLWRSAPKMMPNAEDPLSAPT